MGVKEQWEQQMQQILSQYSHGRKECPTGNRQCFSDMEQQMYKHAENLEFEEAARLRDEITQIRQQTLITDTATS